MTVELGTGCVVRVINRPEDAAGVHGFFVPGGMADLAGTLTEIGEPQTNLRPDRSPEGWVIRQQLQQMMARMAVERNLPMLGVCGGSRALAQTVGGDTRYLPGESRGRHNLHFGEPWRVAHNVRIDRSTRLGSVVEGGHYLNRRPALRGQTTELPVNSMHWAQSHFDPASTRNVVLSTVSSDDDVLEGWELAQHPFFLGVQFHPEFAQIAEGDFADGQNLGHARIMNALGQAAHETVAATILQTAIRVALAQRAVQSIGTRFHGVMEALQTARGTRGVRRGELDNPLTSELFRTLERVDSYLSAVQSMNQQEAGRAVWNATRGRVLSAVQEVKSLAWRDESISVQDAEAIDDYIRSGRDQYRDLL
jgi:gamma-glutamyl-gamma-aminobutyrate hydrolase PuuD